MNHETTLHRRDTEAQRSQKGELCVSVVHAIVFFTRSEGQGVREFKGRTVNSLPDEA